MHTISDQGRRRTADLVEQARGFAAGEAVGEGPQGQYRLLARILVHLELLLQEPARLSPQAILISLPPGQHPHYDTFGIYENSNSLDNKTTKICSSKIFPACISRMSVVSGYRHQHATDY